MKKVTLVVFALFFLLFTSSFSAAKSFHFPQVNLFYNISDDTSVSVREELTFGFSGSFSFTYRDLPDGKWSYSNQRLQIDGWGCQADRVFNFR